MCEHQPLPLMKGDPLQRHVDSNDTTVAIHKPALVPLHWQDKVYADLERDSRIGFIEQVSRSTPTTWCFPMTVTAKADGSPKHTIDLQPQYRMLPGWNPQKLTQGSWPSNQGSRRQQRWLCLYQLCTASGHNRSLDCASPQGTTAVASKYRNSTGGLYVWNTTYLMDKWVARPFCF